LLLRIRGESSIDELGKLRRAATAFSPQQFESLDAYITCREHIIEGRDPDEGFSAEKKAALQLALNYIHEAAKS